MNALSLVLTFKRKVHYKLGSITRSVYLYIIDCCNNSYTSESS